ncbi:hypothetical protein FRB93_000047 [Tulasnella sp. JGI-2019a]|nr:hypothetical protein FRB93_000047 [Tulasnella sp. JGI-2019a]
MSTKQPSAKAMGKRKAIDPSSAEGSIPVVSPPKKRAKAGQATLTNRPSPAPSDASEDPYTALSKKPVAKPKGKGSVPKVEKKLEWPPYFDELFKIFKALNTVIVFCSSRQHIATTFSVVKKSVEGLLKKPLDLSQVAEIKAIIPDLMRFAYISSSELRIHSDQTSGVGGCGSSSKKRDASPDWYTSFGKADPESGETVLVLDFVEGKKMRKADQQTSGNFPGYALPPSMNPVAVKKLIEKRNERFSQAVNELLLACALSGEDEDPVVLVMKAAKDHLPLGPFGIHTAGRREGENPGGASIEAIVDEIIGAEDYRGQIAGRRVYEAKEPQWGKVACFLLFIMNSMTPNSEHTFLIWVAGQLSQPLSKSITDGLRDAINVTRFFTHQTAAINALRANKHVIVSTGTASGKSIIYQVPLLTFLEGDRESTAIFIFPTKALAQDQRTALEQLLCHTPGLEDVQVATYDGDTPMSERADIRENASVIFTNFDILHITILPQEDKWRRFLKNIKLVVVDELHYYHGTLGRFVMPALPAPITCRTVLTLLTWPTSSSFSHAAYIMRRLRRVCAAVGNRRSLFVSCSATIGQPLRHMETIFGVDDIEVVTEDGSSAGRKDFLIWNPPLIDEMDPKSGRASAYNEVCAMFRFLVKRGVKTIIFCKIRKSCELVMKTLRTQLAAEGRQDILEKIRAYRGGYSQQDRRAIEKEAFTNKLLGIVATNALELGINIGTLDAVIMLGFPMSVASLRQQAGRAGRRAQGSLAVYVADNLPIDQHFVSNPDEIFDMSMADLVVDLSNEVVLEGHLQCAANEMPISITDDEQYFGDPALFRKVCRERLTQDAEGWYHTHSKYKPRPSTHVPIRGVMETKYTVLDVTNSGVNGKVMILEELELSRALFETYEGGIFMHQGMTYLVREVSHDDRTARIVQTDVNWTTTPRDFTDVDPIQTIRIRAIRGSPHRAYFGPISVKTIIFGFFKVRNGSILDTVDLDTPPFERQTNGMWIDVPNPVLDLIKRKGLHLAEAIHAAAHAVLNLAPLFATASSGDVKTECKVAQKEYASKPTTRKRPARLIFFDNAGKSSGVAAKAFDHSKMKATSYLQQSNRDIACLLASDMLTQALERLEACECESGCPSCIEDSECKEGNLVASKTGAKLVLRAILDLPIDENAIPDVDPRLAGAVLETIMEATGVYTAEGVEVEFDECQE